MRIKVKFHLKNQQIIIDRRSHLDGLLLAALMEKLYGRTMQSMEVIKEVAKQLPIRKVELDMGKYFYLCSRVKYDAKWLSDVSIVKVVTLQKFRPFFDIQDLRRIAKKYKIESGRGPYKQFQLSYTPIVTPCIEFIAEITDKGLFEDLISRIYYIGKKRALGFGEVSHYEIEPTDEKIIRAVPVEYECESEPVAFMGRYLPPYWWIETEPCKFGVL